MVRRCQGIPTRVRMESAQDQNEVHSVCGKSQLGLDKRPHAKPDKVRGRLLKDQRSFRGNPRAQLATLRCRSKLIHGVQHELHCEA
jgi:hypothetical protein